MADDGNKKLPRLGDDDEDDDAAGDRTKVESIESRRGALLGGTRKQTAYFIVLTGAHAGQTFRAPDGLELTLGRAPEAEIRLQDEGISRKHARVVITDGIVAIEDLKSANGTIVNGSEVAGRRVLKDGDKVQLGSTTILKFTYHDDLDEKLQRDLYDAAQRDGLTRAYNRRFFTERLTTEFAFALRHQSPLSVVIFDVDHFKKVNDTHGHLAGDAVLVMLAQTVAATVRTEDVFARYGGEEFAVICRATGLPGGELLGERIRKSVEQASTTHAGIELRCTVSVGVGIFPAAGITRADQLVGAADAALYWAKNNGRNRVACSLNKGA